MGEREPTRSPRTYDVSQVAASTVRAMGPRPAPVGGTRSRSRSDGAAGPSPGSGLGARRGEIGPRRVVEPAGHPGGALRDPVVPGLERRAAGHVLHRDAARYRADGRAQVAADALALVHPHDVGATRLPGRERAVARGREVSGLQRLVRVVDAVDRRVAAGDVAQVAPDALVGVDLGHDLVVEVEIA